MAWGRVVALARDDIAAAKRGHDGLHRRSAASAEALAAARLEAFSARLRRGLDPFPEIDCLRHRLPPGVIAAAEQRAASLKVGADEVLVAEGTISREAYCRALAIHLGLRFVNLDGVPRAACPAGSDLLLQAPNGGLLPLVSGGGMVWAVAPRGLAARHLALQLRKHSDLRRKLVVTTPEHVRRFVQRHERAAIAWHAAERLRTTAPLMSAGSRGWGGRAMAAAVLATVCAAFAAMPGLTIVALQVAISVVFLAWTILRLVAIASARRPQDQKMHASVRDSELPVYSIVIALYREAATLPELVTALRALDYPPEKLNVLLVLEGDDPQTRAMVDMQALGPPFEVVFAPSVAPRTKPKALNAALPFARGAFTVVYDAEDKPEADQLRRAVAAFAADNSGRLACLQARLTIDNTDDSWLAGLFTAEYAGLFDVMLPGLAAHELPIPLGGTSNHFRTQVLRDVGGWDAHNVTEDADLGTRLARAGHRVGVLDSSTYEEAPSKVRPWLRQRTRWFKGWMQTWGVHMRRPWCLMAQLGPGGFATFQLLFIGTVAAALLQPFAWLLLLVAAAGGWPGSLSALDALHWSALAAGYLTSVGLAVAGLARRGLWRLVVLMPLMLVHWVLLSVAAWRAVFQLLRDPYRWDKTDHGLGRTSRWAKANPPTDSAADRPPPLPAAA